MSSPGHSFLSRLAVLLLPLAHFLAAQTPARISLQVTPDSSVLGAQVKLTATVAPAGATGRVTFYDGVVVLGVANLSGDQASLLTHQLPAGNRTLRVHYGGDHIYLPGNSSAVSHLVTALPSSGLQTRIGYAAGPGPALAYLAAADFNNDRRQDLLTATAEPGELTVLLSDSRGGFRAPVRTVDVGAPAGVAVGDFNGDGHTDVATADTAAGVRVFLGNGDGSFRPAVTYPTESRCTWIAASDFNLDGNTDLIVAHSSTNHLSVLLGTGDGTFQPASTFTVPGSATSVVVEDFNSDGSPDLAVIASATLTVLPGNPDGTFQPASTASTEPCTRSVAAADLNSDGKPDLAVSDTCLGGIRILLGNGDGTFRERASYLTAGAPNSMALGDFNGDGLTDIAASDPAIYSVRVLPGNGDGTFSPAQVYATAAQPGFLLAGEFNGDGRTDLVAAQKNGLQVEVFLGEEPRAVAIAAADSPTGVTSNAALPRAGETVCDYVLTNNPTQFASGPYSTMWMWTANAGCPASLASNASWLTVGTPVVSDGYNVIPISVSLNPGNFRTGTVTFSGTNFTQSFEVSQATRFVYTPNVVSLSPASGSGLNQVFTIQAYNYSDVSNGYKGIESVVFEMAGSDGASCKVTIYTEIVGYRPAGLDLGNDSTISRTALPSLQTLQTKYCTVHAASTAVSGSGNFLTIQLALSFTQALAGSRKVTGTARSMTGQTSNSVVGTWTVPIDPGAPALRIAKNAFWQFHPKPNQRHLFHCRFEPSWRRSDIRGGLG